MTTVPEAEPLNVIYGLSCTCHPEKGVRYVGQTICGVAKRLREHRHGAKKGNLAVHKWMRKHGVGNIEAAIPVVRRAVRAERCGGGLDQGVAR